MDHHYGLIILDGNDQIIFSSPLVRQKLYRNIRGLNIKKVLDTNSFIKLSSEKVDLKNHQWCYLRLNLTDNNMEAIPCECIIRRFDKTNDLRFSILVFPVFQEHKQNKISPEQEMKQYSQNIFHDLNEYLFTISSEISKLKEMNRDDYKTFQESIEIMDKNIEGLSFLIGNLSTYAQISKQLNKRKTNLYEVIEKACNSIIQTTKEHNIEKLDFKIFENGEEKFKCEEPRKTLLVNNKNRLNFQVYCDSDFLQRVFINLLVNALKYSRDQKPPTIRIDLNNETNGYIIKINDNGIGIRKVDQKNIFQRGFRSPIAFVQDCNGSGLGLAISKEIVELHNGKITFDSKKGEYTEFKITLPK